MTLLSTQKQCSSKTRIRLKSIRSLLLSRLSWVSCIFLRFTCSILKLLSIGVGREFLKLYSIPPTPLVICCIQATTSGAFDVRVLTVFGLVSQFSAASTDLLVRGACIGYMPKLLAFVTSHWCHSLLVDSCIYGLSIDIK